MGVTECDNMLMLLGVSNKMSEKVRGYDWLGIRWQNKLVRLNKENVSSTVIKENGVKSKMIIYKLLVLVCDGCLFPGFLQERDKVMPLIIQGFKDASEEAGTSVTGGQTVLNPWVVMGGVATTVCQPNEFIMWEWTPAAGFDCYCL